MNDKQTPKTASELIDLLGGTKVAGERFDVLPSAVSNWRKNGFPQSMQYRVFCEAKGAGIDLPEDFFSRSAA